MNDLCKFRISDGLICIKLDGHSGQHDAYLLSEMLNDLPKLISDKIKKTCYTRGAQPKDRVPYQNRVSRWGRVVIPYEFKEIVNSNVFENGHVIMMSPEKYFDTEEPISNDIKIGENAFVYYDTRERWQAFPPLDSWKEIQMYKDGKLVDRTSHDVTYVGEYIARVPATTTKGEDGSKVYSGVPQGIRFFEYSSKLTAHLVAYQLAYLSYNLKGIFDLVEIDRIPDHLLAVLNYYNLIEKQELIKIRAINNSEISICPLCLEELTALELMNQVKQAPGREISDLTVTELNLFHLEDLKPGSFEHDVYKVAWGHHHCNAVCRDNGILVTLEWFKTVLDRNAKYI